MAERRRPWSSLASTARPWLVKFLPWVLLVLAGCVLRELYGLGVPLIPLVILGGMAILLMVMRHSIARAWENTQQKWSSVPSQDLPISFGARQQKKINRVFVIPRWPSAIVGLLSSVLFLQGLLFDQPMGMLLGLMAVVLCLLSLFDCHLNLAGLRVESAWAEDGVAGRPQFLRLGLRDADSRRRQGLLAEVVGPAHSGELGFFEIPPQGSQLAVLGWCPPSRGVVAWPTCRIHTTLPFGLSHAWIQFCPAGKIYVSPAPEVAAPPIPAYATGLSGSVSTPRPGNGVEWMDLRQHRVQDGLSRVAWKESARRSEMLTRVHEEERSDEKVVDWRATEGLPYEMRLSRLAAWVTEANASGVSYSLMLPVGRLGPARGAAHLKECMRALALMPQEGAP